MVKSSSPKKPVNLLLALYQLTGGRLSVDILTYFYVWFSITFNILISTTL